MNLADILESRDVPNPPGSALQVIEIKNDPEAGIDDLVGVVSKDPALAAKILATANSPAYRRGDPVTSIERAVRVLGFRSVTTISLALAVASTIPVSGEIAGISLPNFWSHSLLTTGASRLIATEVQRDLVEEAFFVGLVAGLGRITIGLVAPDEYEPLAQAHDGWPSLHDERAAFGFSSAEVTAALLRKWGMPELLVDACELLETVEPAPPEGIDHVDLARVVMLAIQTAAFCLDGGGGEKLGELIETAQQCGIEPDVSDGILDEVSVQVADLAQEFGSGIDVAGYRDVVDRAREELVSMSLQTEMEWHVERTRRRELEEATSRLKIEARRDPLTGLCNRRAFDELLDKELNMRLRQPRALSKKLGLIMLDIDHFKAVNDTHGHDGGDAVLQMVARVLEATTREEETLARIGGEEFVLLVPNVTEEELAKAGERLRVTVERMEIELPVGGVISVTASFGAAAIDRVTMHDDGPQLLKAADEALYEAKNSGRNRVVVASNWS